MSKYVECETEIVNEKALIAALHEMGYTQLKIGKDIHLIGYRGDKRSQTADIVIPRKYVRGSANDIGFKKQPDGTFKALVSEFDMGQDKNFVKNVSELAAVNNVELTAVAEGWTSKRIKNKQGEVAVELERWT